MTVAADDEVEHLGGIFRGGGIDHLQTCRRTQCQILREEVLFADGVNQKVVVPVGEVLDGIP